MSRALAYRLTALLAVTASGACVNEPSAAPPLPPLAADAEQPALALIEHVLAEHFAGPGAGADPPTTCAELRPGGLTAEQEQALIARFPRLAPRARCETEVPPPEDEFTGERAVLVQVYDLACTNPAHCTAWATRPGTPATRYTLVFEGGAWRFSAERRVVAE